jgi:sugar phosphate isomerase/epimerase
MSLNSVLAGKLTVSPSSSPRWSIEEDITLYRKLQLQSVNVSMGKIARSPDGQWKRLMGEAGMRVHAVSFDTAGFFELFQPESWPACQESYIQSLRGAAELGADQCVLTTGSGHGRPWEVANAAFQDAIAPVVEVASDLGLRLLFEPVRPQFAHVSYVHSFADAVAVAREAGLGLSVDVVHCWWERGLAAAVRENIDVVGLVQLSDLRFSEPIIERINPGDGELPLAEYIETFLGAGYGGAFDIELVGSALEREGYESAITRAFEYLSGLELSMSPA